MSLLIALSSRLGFRLKGLSSRGQRLLRDPTESPGALLSSESPEVCGNWRGSPSRGPHGSPVYTLTWLSPFSRGAWLTQVCVVRTQVQAFLH